MDTNIGIYDSDESIDCRIITTFEVCGNMYVAALPEEIDKESDHYDLFIFRVKTIDNNTHILEDIEDEAEFLLAKDKLSEVIDMDDFYSIAKELESVEREE